MTSTSPTPAAIAAAKLIDTGIRHELTGLIDNDRVVAIARIIDRAASAGWQGMESAPKDRHILLTDGKVIWIGYWEGQSAYGGRTDAFVSCMFDWATGKKPTHWMPLPQPPSAPSPTKV